MSSLEAVSVGVLAFSFTLLSCFVGVTDQMVLKCSSFSFSTASSLVLCALIRWILLLWLGVSSRGHQRGARAVPSTVVLNASFYPEPREIEWSDSGNWSIQFGDHYKLVPTFVLLSTFASGTLYCSAPTSPEPFSASGFASSLVEVSLLSPVCPWLLLDSSIEGPSFGAPRLC
jgi:hypothetical protein